MELALCDGGYASRPYFVRRCVLQTTRHAVALVSGRLMFPKVVSERITRDIVLLALRLLPMLIVLPLDEEVPAVRDLSHSGGVPL